MILFTTVSFLQVSNLIHHAILATNNFNGQMMINIVTEPEYLDEVNAFLDNLSSAVAINLLLDNNDKNIDCFYNISGYKQTVFFTNSVKVFANFMKILNQRLKESIRLILVLTQAVHYKDLYVFFEAAWKYDLIDIVIVNEDAQKNVTYSTYFPYVDHRCGNCQPIILNKSEKLFPRKINNFHGCPIKISVLKFVPYLSYDFDNETGHISLNGYDGLVFTLAVDTLNATLKVSAVSDRGLFGSYNNNTPTGYFNHLVTHESDILIPPGVLSLKRMEVTQISKIYNMLDIHWIGPKRRQLHPWLKVVYPFLNNITLFLVLATATFVIVAMFVKGLKLENNSLRESVFFQSYVLLLGQVTNFVTKSVILNSLFMLWIWFCFIVRIYYQGSLVNDMEKKLLEPPFTAIEEAVERVDGFGGTEVFMDFCKNASLKHPYTILTLTEINEYIDRIAKGERFLLVADLMLCNKVRHNAQVFSAQFGLVFSCFYIRSGWPAAKEFNTIISRAIDTGIINFLMNGRKVRFGTDESVHTERLSLTTLGPCFYSLTVMWIICLVVFVIENVYCKICNVNNLDTD